MGRNIQYQFMNAIDQSFDGGGHDKHSDKHTGKQLDTVYSYGERSNLMDLSSQVSKFIKENYPDVKKVLDIKGEMIQDFLNSKATTCNKETLGQYASRIHKLEHVINKTYKGNITWHSDLITPVANTGTNKTRDIAMNRKDYSSILNRAYVMGSKSMSVVAIELSGRFALRVSETCKLQPRDIDFDKMRLHVHESKGGRSRDIEISPEDIDFLKRTIDGKQQDKRIVAIKEDSVNKYLTRSQEALNIRSRYRDAKTGVHSIRKMVAQEQYDKHRRNGLSKKEALNKVSEYLGHGKNRTETMKQYILNIY
jgi:integrase